MLEHVNDTLNLITDTYFLSPDQKMAEYASQENHSFYHGWSRDKKETRNVSNKTYK